MNAQLGITTSGWFEVEVFGSEGHVLRRHYETVEEARAILNVPGETPLRLLPAIADAIESMTRTGHTSTVAMEDHDVYVLGDKHAALGRIARVTDGGELQWVA